jgi:LysM repeat protein
MIPKILTQTFADKCHDKQLMQLAQSFHKADFKSKGVFKYKVKAGDSLNKIARKFRCTNRKEIVRLNRLKAPRYLIRAGKYLKIPQC